LDLQELNQGTVTTYLVSQQFFHPFRGFLILSFPPTAFAVGCILSPLRGWEHEAWLSPLHNN